MSKAPWSALEKMGANVVKSLQRRSGLVAFGVLVMVFVGGQAYGALSSR